MTSTATPRPVDDHDAGAMIGVLATLSGELMGRELPTPLLHALTRRLASDGLLPAGQTPGHVLLALDYLVQGLHYAHGSNSEPPVLSYGATRHELDFPDQASASAAARALRQESFDVTDPALHRRRRDRWHIGVTLPGPPLTQTWEEQAQRVRQVGEAHGGHDDGFSCS